MSKSPFEIPEQFREMAEKNVEQASAAYGQMAEAMSAAMGMWMQSMPSNNLAPGFGPVQEKAVNFAKQNAEANLEAAKEFAQAKDVQTLMEIQSRFAQSQMQTYATQAQELGQLMMQSASQPASKSK